VVSVELRAERGRAVLIGVPERFQPPTALAGALDEWAEVAEAVCANGRGDSAAAALVSARGRQLAARLAAAAGTPVGYADPVRGVFEQVSAISLSRPQQVSSGQPRPQPTGGSHSQASEPATRHSRAEPTPWATGLAVSVFFAAVTAVALFILVDGLGQASWWLGALGLVVVTAGVSPSLWVARSAPVWRWISYGAATGIALCWLAVLLSMLGP
jgi:hypothetical protein